MNLTGDSSRALVAATVAAVVAVVAGLAVAGCGGSSSSAPGPSGGNATDRAFAGEMVRHHMLAIQMATLASDRSRSPDIRRLSGGIVSAQRREVATLTAVDRRLAAAGVATGSLGIDQGMAGMDMNLAELRRAQPFDRQFIDMMVPHHRGAIRMARVELARGQNATLRRLAENVVSAQSREIDEMNAMRVKRFGGPVPADGAAPAMNHSMSG